MNIAILSDIHGNIPALTAVLEDLLADPPDLCVVNGDVINRGPNSLGVLRLLQQHLPGATRIKGNHECWILRCRADPMPRKDLPFEVKRFAYWTLDQLGEELDKIAQWPDNLDLTLSGGSSIHFTHGSRLGNRDGIHPRLEEAELPARLGAKRDLFVASHTHIPMIREFEGTLIINSGSVGAPFDRDPRAAYARLSLGPHGWRGSIRRLNYPRQLAERHYEESGFLDQGGPLTRLMLRELQISRGLMGPWMRDYQQAVLKGEIDLESSVAQILAATH